MVKKFKKIVECKQRFVKWDWWLVFFFGYFTILRVFTYLIDKGLEFCIPGQECGFFVGSSMWLIITMTCLTVILVFWRLEQYD